MSKGDFCVKWIHCKNDTSCGVCVVDGVCVVVGDVDDIGVTISEVPSFTFVLGASVTIS